MWRPPAFRLKDDVSFAKKEKARGDKLTSHEQDPVHKQNVKAFISAVCKTLENLGKTALPGDRDPDGRVVVGQVPASEAAMQAPAAGVIVVPKRRVVARQLFLAVLNLAKEELPLGKFSPLVG